MVFASSVQDSGFHPSAAPPHTHWCTQGGHLLWVVSNKQPQGGEVSFGGSIVDRQGTCVRGHGGVCISVMQKPVHHLGVTEAGSQVQDCGTGIVFILWAQT